MHTETAPKPIDDMFDTIPPGPWKVNSTDDTKNRAFIWTDREYPKGYCVAEVHAKYFGQLEKIASAVSAVPDMLEALSAAAELIRTARNYFPKSIRNHNRFQLENTCAAIGRAMAKAKVNQ